jgi:hypothetical protein
VGSEREGVAVLYDGELDRGRRAVLWVSPHMCNVGHVNYKLQNYNASCVIKSST